MHKYYVYIMTNKPNGVLYVGVTNDIARRVCEHKQHINPRSFTSRYNCDKLVYYDSFSEIAYALENEKRLKAGNRAHKEALITSINPNWEDLSQNTEFWMS